MASIYRNPLLNTTKLVTKRIPMKTAKIIMPGVFNFLQMWSLFVTKSVIFQSPLRDEFASNRDWVLNASVQILDLYYRFAFNQSHVDHILSWQSRQNDTWLKQTSKACRLGCRIRLYRWAAQENPWQDCVIIFVYQFVFSRSWSWHDSVIQNAVV